MTIILITCPKCLKNKIPFSPYWKMKNAPWICFPCDAQELIERIDKEIEEAT